MVYNEHARRHRLGEGISRESVRWSGKRNVGCWDMR